MRQANVMNELCKFYLVFKTDKINSLKAKSYLQITWLHEIWFWDSGIYSV